MRRRRWSTPLVGALIALATTPAPAQTGSVEQRFADVQRELLSADSPEAVRVGRQLVGLGVEALPLVHDAWCRALLPPEPRDSEPALRVTAQHQQVWQDAILHALRAIPDPVLEAHLRWSFERSENFDQELRAIQLLGEVGGASGLGLDLEAIQRLPRPSPQERSILRRSVSRILARDRDAEDVLEAAWPELPDVLRPALCAAVADLGMERAGPLLLELLDAGDRGDAVVLQALVSFVDDLPAERRARLRLHLERGLRERDEPERIRACAHLCPSCLDARLPPELIDAMEDSDDPGTRRVIGEALRAMSGRSLGEDVGDWQEWWFAEQDWWRRTEPALRAHLLQDPPELTLRWLRELVDHRVFRDRMVREAAAVLGRPEAMLRAAAASAIASLGGPQALGALRRGLDDKDARVRQVAGQGLRDLTGLALPDQAADWDATGLFAGSVEE